MKKKLEADLISIAHRILKMKNKSDIVQLHQEAQKLYEKLSVLRFVEENFSGSKPTIGQSEIEEKLEAGFDDEPAAEAQPILENLPIEALSDVAAPEHIEPQEDEPAEETAPFLEEEPAPEEKSQENHESDEPSEIEINEEEEAEELVIVDEPVAEPDKKEVFAPSFELSFEPKTEETPKTTPQFSFDDLLGKDYADPVFVKPEENFKREEPVKTEAAPAPEYKLPSAPSTLEKEHKNVSLNDRLSKGIIIGLNDRIAFMKHLFNNSSEDYNRVLSQLITFDTYEEARTFIDEMVKPDYNNWEGKDEYSQRFMEIIEKRFI
ncbi:MAG TPA: hypothetical protein VFQ50_04670 [Flavobacterium sp.]|jgi:hypothetical protein|nr:hypothetical protein [Flavobacterium sp.]